MSLTDMVARPLPVPIVHMGPAGFVVQDPVFKNLVLRVTDEKTFPTIPGMNFAAGIGGSADLNVFSADSSSFMVNDQGGQMQLFSFNPGNLKATWVRRCPPGFYSYKNPNLVYQKHLLQITALDILTGAVRTTTDLAPYLPFAPVWSALAGADYSDFVVGAAYSAGIQGTGFTVVALSGTGPGSEVCVYNTMTGEVHINKTLLGIVNIPDRFLIHNVKLMKDGCWMVIIPADSSNAPATAYCWRVGTTQVVPLNFSGHWTTGFGILIAHCGPPWGQYSAFSPYAPETRRNLLYTLPSKIGDDHPSWHNVTERNAEPFFDSVYANPVVDYTAPWLQEIISVNPISGVVNRYGHTYNSGTSSFFATKYAIGCVSPDAKYFLFSSDWMGTRGDAYLLECR